MTAQLSVWREPETGEIHAGSPDGYDAVLCGYVFEGNPGETEPLKQLPRGRVSCQRCKNIILFCKAIPASRLKKTGARDEGR